MGIVLPGDGIVVAAQDRSALHRLGPGLISSNIGTEVEDILATQAGLLGYSVEDSPKAGRAVSRWIDVQTKRYIPAVGEPVIGVIIARHAEGYRVDIGSAHIATLDGLAFEGATKRSKPSLKVGAIVYARVTLAHQFAEPEVECIDPVSQKAQGYGELTGGALIRSLSLQKCRALLSPAHPLLPSFGARFPFECAIGLNGRAWFKGQEPEQIIEIITALRD